jgi:Spy/CpxP family protein refolding chaperone
MFAKRIFSIGSVICLVLAFSSAASAQKPRTRLARMKNVLGLTDPQVNDVRDLLRKHRQVAFLLRQDLRAANRDLRAGLESNEPSAVGQLVIIRHSLKSQLRQLGIKLQGDIAARLTPEQKRKFGQMRARRQTSKRLSAS